MSDYDLVLLPRVILDLIGTMIFIVFAISLIMGKNYFDNKKEIKLKNKYFDFFLRRIVSSIIIIFGIYIASEALLDIVVKDYQNKAGVVSGFSAPKNDFLAEEVWFKDEESSYYLPKKYLKKAQLQEGKRYKFTYAKRTLYILDITKIN